MQENEKNLITEESPETENIDYISAFKELKENTVEKSVHDKLKAEHARLWDAFTSGKELQTPKQLTTAELWQKLPSAPNSMEWWQAVMDIRSRELSAGRDDVLMPFGSQVQTTPINQEQADKLARGITYCLERSEGDPDLFRTYLNKITVDTPKTAVSR